MDFLFFVSRIMKALGKPAKKKKTTTPQPKDTSEDEQKESDTVPQVHSPFFLSMLISMCGLFYQGSSCVTKTNNLF